MVYTVPIEEIVTEFNLENVTPEVSLKDRLLSSSEINRPALQLAGFYDYFDSHRFQIVGKVEYAYLEKMDPVKRHETILKLYDHQFPALTFCRGLEPFPEFVELSKKTNIPLFRTTESTSDFTGELIRWLRVKLANRVTMHGVLVDIYGEGVLIMGESGIGKSETALELIKRGHRLVADDAVEIKRASNQTLIGSCPEIIRYFIELRGIGIIDVLQMFGVESIKATQSIDLVIKLEYWDNNTDYDRLGLKEEYMDILGNNVVCHSIPIRPGRNLAIICESAAINHRQKKMGYNAAQKLNERVMNSMNPKS